MSSAATSNSGTVWSLLLLLAVVPAAYLYGQYSAKGQGSSTAGSSKTAAKKRKKAAAKAKAMAEEASVSTGSTVPSTFSSEAVQDASPSAAVAGTSSSKKSRRKKNKAATTTPGNDTPTGAENAHAIPGSFDAPTPKALSTPATGPAPTSTSVDEWQTTRSDRKNKKRSQKATAAPTTLATAVDQAPVPAPKPSTPSVSSSAEPESLGSASSVQATAWPQEEPIDWGNAQVDGNWSAGAAWDDPASIAPSSATENKSEDTESDNEVVAYPTPVQAARTPTEKTKQRQLKGKSAAELHPSVFFASTPAVTPVAQPKAPVWENVSARSARPTSNNASRSHASAGAAVSSRFSSQNAFSTLKEEGDVSLDKNGNASRVVRVATSPPFKGGTKAKPAPPVPTSEPTKKQRQNAAKREAARLAREEAEQERVAALATHRRARTTPRAPAPPAKSGFASVAKGGQLDQATLLQLAQGSRKQPSGGQRAQVDERGNLIWQ